jgi:hypothetical protein
VCPGGQKRPCQKEADDANQPKKKLMTQINQIMEALKAAEQAAPPLPQSKEPVG